MHPAQALALLLAIVKAQAAAQILSCGQLPSCPTGGGMAQCNIEGSVAQIVGVSELNTTLTSRPFTWTIAITSEGPVSNKLDAYRKDFYLGQPPHLRLQTVQNVTGCALFFNGISSTLQHGGTTAEDYVSLDVTCTDVLTPVCISEWTKQAKEEVSKALRVNGTVACDNVAVALQNNPPSQCSNVKGTWGDVSSKDITGPTSSPPLNLTTCHPTISSNYSITRIEKVTANLSSSFDNAFYNFMGGVTPVMTIFAPSTGGGITPEVHLNCLKVKSDNFTTSGNGSVTSAAGLRPSRDSYLAALCLLFAMVWML